LTRKEAISFIKDHEKIGKVKRTYDHKKIKESEKYQKLLEFIGNIPNFKSLKIWEILFCLENDFNDCPICQTCLKPIPFKIERHSSNKEDWYIKKFCSIKCFNNNPKNKLLASKREKELAPQRLETRKNTIEKKYGSWSNRPGANNFRISNRRLKTDNIFRENRNQKIKETNLERYGVEHLNQRQGEAKKRREKANKTCLKKYNVENPTQAHLKNNHLLTKKHLEKNFLDKNGYIKLKEMMAFFNMKENACYKYVRENNINLKHKGGGFNPNKPAILYYLYDPQEDLYKIGITNLTIEERFGKSFCSNRAIVILEQIEYSNGMDAYLAEQEILEAFGYARCENPSWPPKKGGATEFFKWNILQNEGI